MGSEPHHTDGCATEAATQASIVRYQHPILHSCCNGFCVYCVSVWQLPPYTVAAKELKHSEDFYISSDCLTDSSNENARIDTMPTAAL